MIHKKEIQFFDDNGYLFIDKFIKKNIITGIKIEISKTLKKIEKDSKDFDVLYEDDGSIRLVRNIHDNIDFFKKLVVSSSLIEIAKSLLKSDVYVLNSKLNVKSAFTGGHFDWHQDYSYWADQYSKPDMISMSIFVDDISPHNAPIMVIPGSHKRGLIKVPHRDKMSVEEKKSYPKLRRNNLSYSLPNEIIMEEANKNKIIEGVGSTGSVFIFHSNTFHASSINLSPFDRSTILIRYNSINNA
ncbi:uncharacterized protein METZ01_LOCUS11946 [marine metagenome]|uniref:Phytanoyl-CoA dioxygenase n=1 Tax=marine metagenome TaxID=408172 RepID=A0A381NWU1_9ZZZZ